ncbi:MAG TPA: PhzF family phenazine biosynthesis protein [Rhizomicrobium sp.]|nr:PhzF family phenazine biosynthesis protein [Rhizomicrobium sp.]
MNLKLWQVDAFAEKPLEGNPAAILPLERFLPAELMQRIANENNLAETAFLVWKSPGQYDLRWFTPESEVDLCGHATLASAWLIFEELDPELKQACFDTRSGTLVVDRGRDGRHSMSLPSDSIAPFDAPPDFARHVGDALGTVPPKELYRGRYVMGVWDAAGAVRGIRGPGNIGSVLRKVNSWGLIATAPDGQTDDFISRFFAPDKGVPEDPVTGSAHCALVPFWAKRIGKKTLKARQVSPRGGYLLCTDDGDRTILAGSCALYLRGEITV